MKNNRPVDYQELHSHLSHLFGHVNLPPTGITRAWLNNLAALDNHVEYTIREHGVLGIQLIQQYVNLLSPVGAKLWEARSVLLQIHGSITDIEKDVLSGEGVTVENDGHFMSQCEKTVGLCTWYTKRQEAYVDESYKQIFGLPPDHKPVFENYIKRLVRSEDKDRMVMKIKAMMTGEVDYISDYHVVRRMDGEERRIFSRAFSYRLPPDELVLAGYVRDVTGLCVMLNPTQPLVVVQDDIRVQ
jgi:hypothetical protein